MRRALALLMAGLALAGPAAAQFGAAPQPGIEAEAHIASAFTSRADPRVLSESVALGPALREQLGADADRRRIYDSLVALVAGKPLRTRSLPAAEAARHASLPGVNVTEPLVMLEAGEVRLLLQYAAGEKNIVFAEQLAGPTVAAPTPPQAPKAEPIVEVPLPTEAPPAPVVAPPVAVQKPAAVPKPVPPAPRAEKPRPVPPPIAAQPAAPPSTLPSAPQRECVIKPVMSDEDLRACGAMR